MKIKIEKDNADKIESALHEINGTAKSHTLTSYAELEYAVEKLAKKLNAIGLVPSKRKGAYFLYESGSAVPNAYKNTRVGTRVRIDAVSEYFYLTSIEKITLYNQAGKEKIFLTLDQSAYLVDKFQKQWSVYNSGE